ncbi:MAG: VCBS repeat-containing protein [Lentisphaerae bacterium]|nr:VCBS repeat-containing protein [Lentisphaerota bacterium]
MKKYLLSAMALAATLQVAAGSVAVVTNVAPRPWDVAVPLTNGVTAFLDSAPIFGATNFTCSSRWRGKLDGSVSVASNALVFTPTLPLWTGEPIEATVAASGLDPSFSWRFAGAADEGSGLFITNASSFVFNSGGSNFFLNISVADIDANGDLDIIAPDWITSNVVIFANSGGTNFTPSTYSGSQGEFYDVTVADINSDQQPDLLFAGADEIVVSTTNAGGAPTGWQVAYSGGGSKTFRRLSSGDLNGDGLVDVVALAESPGHILTFLNDGSGGFTLGNALNVTNTLFGLDVGDLNGDGSLDAVACGPAGYTVVVTNDGSGILSVAHEFSATALTLYVCRIADFDRDGSPDIAVAGAEGTVALGHAGGGTFSFASIAQPHSSDTIYGLAAGDLDADGWPDLVLAAYETVGLLQNEGGITFRTEIEPTILSGKSLRDVELGDFNGDGALDAVVCGLWSGSITILWNSPEPSAVIYGIDANAIVSGEAPSLARGTDFGGVPIIDTVSNQFSFANDGLGPLIISGTEISGAATGTMWVTDMPTEIAPGATSIFSVVYAPREFGASTSLVSISHNGPLSASNTPYRITFTGVGIKKPVDLLSLTNNTHTYDGTAQGVDVTVSPSVTTLVAYAGSAMPPTNAGVYVVTVDVDDALYSGSITGALTIAQRALAVQADDVARGYGATNPPLTFAITNFAPTESESDLAVIPVATTAATTNSPLGDYAISISGGSATNYSFAYSNGTLTVNQAALTVRAEDKNRLYNTTNPPLTIVYEGFQNGEGTNVLDVLPSATTTADVSSVAGVYPIVVSGGSATNYAFNRVDGSLHVFAQTAQVSFTNLTHTYDGSPHGVTSMTDPTGLVVVVTYDAATNAPTDAGSYAVEGVIDEINYQGSNTTTLTILKADQVITNFLPVSGTYPSEETLALSAAGSPSGIAPTFAVVSGPGIMIASNSFRFTGFGPVSVTTTQPADSNWNASAAVTNTYMASDTNPVHYAAMDGQTSVWPYASWPTAASNIMDAATVAEAGDRVLVGDGVYLQGEVPVAGMALTNRVVLDKAISVLSVNGPATTTIVGRPAAGAAAPLGPDAMRCLYMTNGAFLAGFTLRDGATLGLSGATIDQSGGGVLMLGGSSISNCVLEGNSALYGGAAHGGALTRCVVRGNSAIFDGGGLHSVTVDNSLVWSNSASFGSGVFRSTLRQCTVAANTAAYGAVYESISRNCIVYHNTGGDVFGGDAEYTCAANGISLALPGNTFDDPLFVDVAGGDLYLLHDSPCINTGLNAHAPTNGVGLIPDVTGGPRIRHGIVDLGAYEYDATPEFILIAAASNITAHGFDANWVAPTGTVTIRQYTLAVSNILAATDVELVVNGTQTLHEVTGLEPGTAYAYRMRPQNEYAVGVWSDWTNLVTLTEGDIELPASLAFDAVYGGTNPAPQSFGLVNTGETAYAWSATKSPGGAGTWLTLTPSTGTVAALTVSNLTASVDLAGVDAGIYTVTNVISSLTATNSPQLQGVTLTLHRGTDIITFGATNQIYSGTGRVVSAISSNAQSVAVTYDGSSTPPVGAGVYAVTGIVDSVNWTATNTTLLTVAPASQAITSFLPPTGGYDSTNTLALSALGGGSGYPVLFAVSDGPGLMTSSNTLRFTDYGVVALTASQAGDTNWTAAPVMTNLYTVLPVTNLLHYVAMVGQTPVWPYAATNEAASNLQAGVDAAWNGDRVEVAPGTYDQGGRAADGFELVNRLLAMRPATIYSAEGPDVTIIAGAAGGGGGPGVGAVRCASLSNGAVLEGFTLDGGATLGGLNLFKDRSGAGALLADTAELRYCIVRNGQAADYGGGAYLLEGGSLVNCVAYSNSASLGGGVYLFRGGSVLSSTLARNSADLQGGGAALFEGGRVINTMASQNSADTSGNDLYRHISGDILYSSASDGVVHGVDGNITNAPTFVNAPADDYRLLSGSAGIDVGRDADAAGPVDLEGDPRIIGTIDMGADEFMSVPDAPTPLPASDISALALTANWQIGGSMPVDGYVLYVVRTNDSAVAFSNSVGNATNSVVTNLLPNTAYRYRIKAYNTYGDSPWSADIDVTTLHNDFAPVMQPVSDVYVLPGQALVIHVVATDGDGTVPTLSMPTGPLGSLFVDDGGGLGTFSWTPVLADLGDHALGFSASDGQLSGPATATVHVVLNIPPTPAEISTQYVVSYLLLGVVPDHSTTNSP